MLRIHLLQQWFGYSDPGMEEALHEKVIGQDRAIEALARIADRTVPLIILGEGAEREALVRQAAMLGLGDRLRLPGHVPDPMPAMSGVTPTTGAMRPPKCSMATSRLPPSSRTISFIRVITECLYIRCCSA